MRSVPRGPPILPPAPGAPSPCGTGSLGRGCAPAASPEPEPPVIASPHPCPRGSTRRGRDATSSPLPDGDFAHVILKSHAFRRESSLRVLAEIDRFPGGGRPVDPARKRGNRLAI